MKPEKPRQRRLLFMDQKLWAQIPEAQRERCHQLLRKLLREVVLAEARRRRNDHD